MRKEGGVKRYIDIKKKYQDTEQNKKFRVSIPLCSD